jgi:hypothetical protein
MHGFTLVCVFSVFILLYTQAHNKQALPEQIIVFRDGVGETYFDMVLTFEVGAMRSACRKLQVL